MKPLLYLLSMLLSYQLYAQSFQGEATYVTKRNFSINLDGAQMSEQRKKMIAERMKQFGESTHTLIFSPQESIFKREESLDPQTPGRGGMRFRMMGAGGGALHVDLVKQQYTQQQELMGKFFLIQDSLERPQWKMSQESKQIGQYNCLKATYTRTQRSRVFQPGKRPEPGEEPEFEEEEIEVVAWYTPQIPVSTGPNRMTGLPGLILEVNDGSATTLCTQVVLNSKDKKTIEVPKKGKVVDQETFEKIQEERIQEMRERYQNNSGRGRSERIIIRG